VSEGDQITISTLGHLFSPSTTMHSDAFDVIPFEVRHKRSRIPHPNIFDHSRRTSRVIGRNWVLDPSGTSTKVNPQTSTSVDPLLKLPAATYLGIDVAIKEVLPSADYDVAKYFEREWRLMKSAHPYAPRVIQYSSSLS